MLYQIKKKLFKVAFLFSIICVKLFAVGVDTIRIPSICMNKSFSALIVIPDSYYNSSKKFPVLYLLHGHSSGPTSWYLVIPNLKEWANKYQIIIVCPDGDFDSWYLDSPEEKNRLFETYISDEVIHFIDQKYQTISNRNARAISGISMGGHGALYLGLKHPEVYRTIGSSSGGLDLLAFPKDWNLQSLLGPIHNKRELWKQYSCFYILDPIQKTDQNIWIDCGTDDFFLKVNRSFHQKLLSKNIEHQYYEGSGGHDLVYWKSAYKKQLIYLMENLKQKL